MIHKTYFYIDIQIILEWGEAHVCNASHLCVFLGQKAFGILPFLQPSVYRVRCDPCQRMCWPSPKRQAQGLQRFPEQPPSVIHAFEI